MMHEDAAQSQKQEEKETWRRRIFRNKGTLYEVFRGYVLRRGQFGDPLRAAESGRLRSVGLRESGCAAGLLADKPSPISFQR